MSSNHPAHFLPQESMLRSAHVECHQHKTLALFNANTSVQLENKKLTSNDSFIVAFCETFFLPSPLSLLITFFHSIIDYCLLH